jgi:heme/copper-type cytochrome/quinol oxidase subunit 2
LPSVAVRYFLFVGFSNDRGLIFIWLGVVVLVIITIVVIVVWVSRRHRVAYDGRQSAKQMETLSEVRGHVGAPVDVATFTRIVTRSGLHRIYSSSSQHRRKHCAALLR